MQLFESNWLLRNLYVEKLTSNAVILFTFQFTPLSWLSLLISLLSFKARHEPNFCGTQLSNWKKYKKITKWTTSRSLLNGFRVWFRVSKWKLVNLNIYLNKLSIPPCINLRFFPLNRTSRIFFYFLLLLY